MLYRRRSRRRSVRRVLALLAALAALTAVTAPAAQAAQMAAVQAHLGWSRVDGAEMDRQLDHAKAGGAQLVRVDIGWSSLEQNAKGTREGWYVSKVDSIVSKAEARGLKLLLTFVDSPCWASSAPEELKQGCTGSWWNRDVQRYPPRNPADYADALAFMVARYGDRVHAWEIWNEPNSDYYFRSSNPVADYTALAKAAYPAAKQADGRPVIVAGALASSDYAFADRLYRSGIKGSFDAFAIHPYTGDKSPLDPQPDAYIKDSFIRGVPAVHDVMVRNGDDKPLWLTEFGWSTATVRNRESWANGVAEQTQAKYLLEAFRQMRSWSYVPVGVWFNLQDTDSDLTSRFDNYGLFRFDGSPKPAYAAFRSAAAELGTPPPSGDGSGSGTSTGTGSGTDSGTGTGSERGEIVLKVRRKRRKVYARGVAPPNSLVRLRGYRYNRRHHRWRVRSSYRKTVRVGGSGRFLHRFRKRSLRHGKWRFTAKLAGAHGADVVVARLR